MIGADLSLALDPVAFAHSLDFHSDAWQTKALRWSGNRLLLNCHRQSGKSTTAAILGLHTALYFPESLVLLVSPSLRQSSELFRKVRDFMSRLPEKVELPEDNKLSCEFPNGSRVVSLPGTEATVRGYSGASLIIEDEASRVADELYYAMRPMLAVSHGRLILMSTPYGQRGHFWQEWNSAETSWERIRIAASDNPRISPDFLLEEQRTMGDWWFQQEYMGVFLDAANQVFSTQAIQAALSPNIEPIFGGRGQTQGNPMPSPIAEDLKPIFGGG